jgi:low temperature requirement protein LtrA
MARPLVSPEDQGATFIELFFDLVFVYGITQVVGLMHHELGRAAAGHAILVFWMIWWGWTQYTWAFNAVDTTHPIIRVQRARRDGDRVFHGGGGARGV